MGSKGRGRMKAESLAAARLIPPLLWGGLVLLANTKRQKRSLRAGMACALALSMGTQLWLLHMDGLLSLETGLPLHLCGLFGVLSIPLLWRAPDWLYEVDVFLAAPAAAITLLFPAVIQSSQPFWMTFAFQQLHALVALTPMLIHRMGKPLPRDPRRALVLGNGYLVLVALFNRVFGTNYLFLRAVPRGTPLQLLFMRGGAFYVCALEMLCMLVFVWLKAAFDRMPYGRK